MKKGLILFHRGWTDQIAMMPIINYYNTIYDQLTILNVPYAKPLFDFYLRNKNNITTIYSSDFNSNGVRPSKFYPFPISEYDYLFHGKHDKHRNDEYKDVYMSVPWNGSDDSPHFGNRYYEFYDIDFIDKINYFEFERDLTAEEEKFNEFQKNFSSNYILYHDNMQDPINMFKDYQKRKDMEYINLNGILVECFQMIKVLQNAKELHLMDSAWAQFCYLLDAKYNLLNNVNVYIYPFTTPDRWGGLLKSIADSKHLKFEPVTLNNWTIIG
jgi:hypothetical protein